jgi:hypothetical protein
MGCIRRITLNFYNLVRYFIYLDNKIVKINGIKFQNFYILNLKRNITDRVKNVENIGLIILILN